MSEMQVPYAGMQWVGLALSRLILLYSLLLTFSPGLFTASLRVHGVGAPSLSGNSKWPWYGSLALLQVLAR